MSSGWISRKTGPLYPFFSAYLLVGWVTGLALVATKWRRAHGQARAQLQYLGVGLLLSVSMAMFLNLALPLFTGLSTYTWLGPYSALILLALVAHAIIRHRLLDLRLVIHRGSAYAALISVAVLVVVALGRLLNPAWSRLPLGTTNDLLAALITALLLLSPIPLRALTLVVDSYLLRPRVNSAALLVSAARHLVHLMRPEDLVAEFQRTIDSALAVRWSLVKLESIDQPIPSGCDHPSGAHAATLLRHASELLDPLESAALLIVDPTRALPHLKSAARALRSAGVDVVAAIGRRDNPAGVFLLGPRRTGDAYFSAELSFVEALIDMLSIAIENALLYRSKLQLLDYANRLIESIDSAVVSVTQQATIDRANTAAERLFGLAPTQPGASALGLPSEVAWGLLLTLQNSLRLRNIEILLDTSSGEVMPVLISTAVLPDERGNATGALAVLTDLSATRELERQRRRAEHLDTMSRLYAAIAHEIRTPLTAISSFVSMLPERFNDPEYRAAAVRLLPAEVSRIGRLADRLRHLAPAQHGYLVPLDLASLSADVVLLHRSVASEHSVTMFLNCPPALPYIRGDRPQLTQLLANLLRNAIEAMPTGGDLLIEVFATPSDSFRHAVTLRVIDSGLGIDPTLQTRIFDPFFTTKSSGTGLGLTICQRIAEFHGATLVLLQRRGRQGTVAEVTFPAIRSGASPPEPLSARLDARAN